MSNPATICYPNTNTMQWMRLGSRHPQALNLTLLARDTLYKRAPGGDKKERDQNATKILNSSFACIKEYLAKRSQDEAYRDGLSVVQVINAARNHNLTDGELARIAKGGRATLDEIARKKAAQISKPRVQQATNLDDQDLTRASRLLKEFGVPGVGVPLLREAYAGESGAADLAGDLTVLDQVTGDDEVDYRKTGGFSRSLLRAAFPIGSNMEITDAFTSRGHRSFPKGRSSTLKARVQGYSSDPNPDGLLEVIIKKPEDVNRYAEKPINVDNEGFVLNTGGTFHNRLKVLHCLPNSVKSIKRVRATEDSDGEMSFKEMAKILNDVLPLKQKIQPKWLGQVYHDPHEGRRMDGRYSVSASLSRDRETLRMMSSGEMYQKTPGFSPRFLAAFYPKGAKLRVSSANALARNTAQVTTTDAKGIEAEVYSCEGVKKASVADGGDASAIGVHLYDRQGKLGLRKDPNIHVLINATGGKAKNFFVYPGDILSTELKEFGDTPARKSVTANGRQKTGGSAKADARRSSKKAAAKKR